MDESYFVHESSYVDDAVIIGDGTKIWHFSHILTATEIGENCNIGQNVVIGPRVKIGRGCKIQNNISIYEGVTLEDYVFCGPSMVFTNVYNPRAEVKKMDQLRQTHVKKGVTIGANATIVCGITIGEFAFIGAGSVINRDVKSYALMVGNPARQLGWVSRYGERLTNVDTDGYYRCPISGHRYQEKEGGLCCLDLSEDAPFPAELASGKKDD